MHYATTHDLCHENSTLQEENVHWNLNFAILLMAQFAKLKFRFRNLSMIAYIFETQKSKFANI